MIDSLEPYQPVLIGIDASSLPDPLVQPATPGVVVTPRPGVAVAIELPLASAGDVDGTLVHSGGGSFAGVELELVNTEGRVASTTRSDFDGFFLFEGVPYGRYSVRIALGSANAARVSTALGGVLLVNGASPSVHLGPGFTKAGRDPISFEELVRSRRLELPRAFAHNDLNVARLPVPPRPHAHERSGKGPASVGTRP